MSPPWRKWKEEVWFGPREVESDDAAAVVQQAPKEKPPRKKEKPPKKEDKRISIDEDQIDDFLKPKCKDYLLLDRRLRALYVVVLCILIGIVAPGLISYYLGEYRADLGNCETPTRYRMECLSGSVKNVTEETCASAGCCYDPNSTPKCFHSNPTRYTYGAVSVNSDEPHELRVDLVPERRDADPFGRPLSAEVVCVVRAVNENHLIIQIKDKASRDGYRLMDQVDNQTALSDTDFEVRVETGDRRSFGITIKRKSTGAMLVDTTYGPIVISPDYVEMSTSVPSTTIFGLGNAGEKRTSFARSFASYAKMALHQRPGAEGFHPFFMGVDPVNQQYHGVYWDNPYPVEVQLSPAPAVTFRAMGGSAVIHVLSGPTPADVSRQLMRDLVGKMAMPPFWSLGFHLCREADRPEVFWDTLNEMESSGIPYDSDCIDSRLSGPGAGHIDAVKFPQALNQREALRDRRKKFVLAQPPHMLEPANGSWITRNKNETDEPLAVKRWNTTVYLPSYSGDSGGILELTGLSHHELWDRIYQPEGVNLVDNIPLDEQSSKSCEAIPGLFIPERLKTSLTQFTLCSTAYHPNVQLNHSAVHSQYGVQHLESWTKDTSGWPRSFHINRASSWGNNGWAAHPGENYTANWLAMQASLVQVLEMGLYGVIQAGSPICGTANSSLVDNVLNVDQEQLCTRWYQLGLLLPYAHSMSYLKHALRSPVNWSMNFRRIIAVYIKQRYMLLPYFYTLFHEAKERGTPVVRPMWYEFHRDANTTIISDQFMIGNAIMVCPAMTQSEDQNSVILRVYFPAGTWYDYHTGQWILKSKGEEHNLVTSTAHVNMFVLNGTVLVTQNPGSSAEDTRRNPYTVTTAAPFKVAQGYLYVDDGVSADESLHDIVYFTFDETSFTMQLKVNRLSDTPNISKIVNTVRVLGLDLKNNQVPQDATYNNVTKVLEFTNLNYDWTQDNEFSFNYIIKQ